MSETIPFTSYNRARIDDRLVHELIGICRGIVVDGSVSQQEAEYLQKWLVANQGITNNALVAGLLTRINQILADSKIDSDEQGELLVTLNKFVGGGIELGEVLKSTTLPLCNPAPILEHSGKHYCFTGTFGYGSRADCEEAVTERGGTAGSLTKKTDFLVIGIYATDSWAFSSYGRKIEKAVQMRNEGHKIAIVGEDNWIKSLVAATRAAS